MKKPKPDKLADRQEEFRNIIEQLIPHIETFEMNVEFAQLRMPQEGKVVFAEYASFPCEATIRLTFKQPNNLLK